MSIYYSFLIDIRSQFTYGYYTESDRSANNYMDNFLSPIYPIVGFGFEFYTLHRYLPYRTFSWVFTPVTVVRVETKCFLLIVDTNTSNKELIIATGEI